MHVQVLMHSLAGINDQIQPTKIYTWVKIGLLMFCETLNPDVITKVD